MNSFEQTQLVEAQHLDELQHVNNVQYLQWVQDIAGAHWQKLIEGKEESFGLWVVRSHHIEYKRQAKLGDRLRVMTHIRSDRRLFKRTTCALLFGRKQPIGGAMQYPMVLPRPEESKTATDSSRDSRAV